eukprot:9062217-Ditylum_brightwellii.AAC.1
MDNTIIDVLAYETETVNLTDEQELINGVSLMNLHTTNTPSKQKAILFNKDLTTIVIEWFMKHKDAMQMHLKTKTDIDEFRKVLGMTSNEIPETVSFAQAWLDLAPEFQEFSNIRFATVEGMHRHISIMLGMTSSSFD